MEKDYKTFPNIPVSHWKTLRAQFKKSIPGTITTNYLASILGMSESSARANIMTPLKMIGLIDENGNVDQERARKYRDDNQYKELCEQIIQENYPKELLDAFPSFDSDREKVKSWFMNRTGVGETGARRMVAFYYTLMEADPSITNDSKSKTTTKPKTQTTVKTSKVQTKSVTEPLIEKEKQTQPKHHSDFPGLNINIQVHISSDATPDQIEKIFEAMGKHLYNR
jgi:hypothetical protein